MWRWWTGAPISAVVLDLMWIAKVKASRTCRGESPETPSACKYHVCKQLCYRSVALLAADGPGTAVGK